MTNRKKKASKKKIVPVKETPGTKVLGTILTNYVQVDVPAKQAKDVGDALGRMIIADFHRVLCNREGQDD